MATRSTIAIENADNTIHQVYCHWDGYISNNGAILQKYYNTRESVEKLIMGADISSLGRYISDKPMDFDNRDYDYTNYYSNRGEITSIRHYKDIDDYMENAQQEEYNYLFCKDDVWSVEFGEDWQDLEYLIQEGNIVDPYTKEKK